ncbi:MAG: hypothetical protein LAQ69_35185 [Acidobacteriia bacterium]|nr:hypothetical protein [Terriglobia bacterium]
MLKIKALVPMAFLIACVNAPAQNAPNVSQVLMWSTVTNTNVGPQFSQSSLFSANTSGNLPGALFTVYTGNVSATADLNQPKNYGFANVSPLNSAISSSIGLALSLIPVASPTSAVILKTDPATGAELPASSTLGPVFTERAETIGKGKFFIGVSHQDFHFTSIDGQNLNGLSILYKGGDKSAFQNGAGQTTTQPATFNLGLDVRLSQDLAFLTYGLSNRVDLSVGLPLVHSAVAATAYNGVIYSGAGLGANGNNCWCQNTFSPGTFRLQEPFIGQSSLSKSGFGDLLVRVKGAVLEREKAVVSVGTDLRFATGDANNYLGTGTTSVKPFVAVSLYAKPLSNGLVFSPHFNVGWQFSGSSVLGGQIQGSPQTATMQNGDKVTYLGVPLTITKGKLPDVLAWAAGAELALGRRNTVVADILGNQIGWINGAQTVTMGSAGGFSATAPFAATTATGLVDAGRTSFGQYSGSFGYKVRVAGALVVTFNALVRFDNNGLTARVVPLYGLSYSF